MAKRRIFLTPDMVYELTALTSVSTIVIEPLEYVATNLLAVPNSISVKLQGVDFAEVAFADIDNVDNIGKFSINTANQLVLVVDNTKVTNLEEARKYIWGIVVTYLLKPLTYADNIPTYIMTTRTSMGMLVSETVATNQPDLQNKMRCLDSSLDLNENGPFIHTLIRSVQ